MDLDRHSLELMLNLLESDASHRNALDDCGMSSSQLHKNKQKVRELCAEIQSQGHAKHLNLDNITVNAVLRQIVYVQLSNSSSLILSVASPGFKYTSIVKSVEF